MAVQLVTMLAGEDLSTDKLPGTRVVGLWQYMPDQKHIMQEAIESDALQTRFRFHFACAPAGWMYCNYCTVLMVPVRVKWRMFI